MLVSGYFQALLPTMYLDRVIMVVSNLLFYKLQINCGFVYKTQYLNKVSSRTRLFNLFSNKLYNLPTFLPNLPTILDTMIPYKSQLC